MPDAIRIRGKKRKKTTGQAQIFSSWQEGSSSSIVEQLTRRRRPSLSRLESLPLEILETIFVFSANTFLPICSRTLFANLSSQSTKRKLVIRYFGVVEERVQSKCYSSKKYILAPAETDDNSMNSTFGLGSIQNSLLKTKWLDSRFIRKCQTNFYVTYARLRLLEFMAHSQSAERKRQLFKLESCITNFLRRFQCRVCPKRVDQSGTFLFTRDDGVSFHCCFPELDYGQWWFMAIRICSAGIAQQVGRNIRGDLLIDERFEGLILQLPFIGDLNQNHLLPKVPRALLRGSWTQDKGDLLQMLFPAGLNGTGVYNDSDWYHALCSAIGEQCYPALQYLVGGFKNNKSEFMKIVDETNAHDMSDRELYDETCHYRQGIAIRPVDKKTLEHQTRSFAGCLAFEKVPYAPRDQNMEIDSMQSPWKILKCGRSDVRPTLFQPNIALHHFDLALEVAERTGDDDFCLYRWLNDTISTMTSWQRVNDKALIKYLSNKLAADNCGRFEQDSVWLKALAYTCTYFEHYLEA